MDPITGSAFLRWRIALRIGTRMRNRASTNIKPMRAIALFLLCAVVSAQDAPPTIKVDVDVVSVLFNVRDKSRGLVGNLSKEDFKIFEDGKEQTVKYFNR